MTATAYIPPTLLNAESQCDRMAAEIEALRAKVIVAQDRVRFLEHRIVELECELNDERAAS